MTELECSPGSSVGGWCAPAFEGVRQVLEDQLAATEPWWPAGARHAYHTNTYGHLVGGVLRHVTGELPGTLRRGVPEPLGADVFFGLPDRLHDRCADVHFDLPAGAGGEVPAIDPNAPGLDPDTRMTLQGYANPPGYSSIGVVNTPEWRRARPPLPIGQ